MVHSFDPSTKNDQFQVWKKIFFSNSYRRVSFAKFCWLIENTVRYLKQYLLSFYAQHDPLFLSIMLNWSIEGNLTLHYTGFSSPVKVEVLKIVNMNIITSYSVTLYRHNWMISNDIS